VIGQFLTAYDLRLLKIHSYVKIKIRKTTSNSHNLNKCYPEYDPEQHSRGFSCRSDTLDNANVDGIITFKPRDSHNSKST